MYIYADAINKKNSVLRRVSFAQKLHSILSLFPLSIRFDILRSSVLLRLLEISKFRDSRERDSFMDRQ